MDITLFQRFETAIRTLSPAELGDAAALRRKFLIAQEGAIEVCYAPLEFINTSAKVVIVGITPGETQMLNAFREASRQLQQDSSVNVALAKALNTAAFSGTMRPNLIGLLNAVGLHRWLRIDGCDQLFTQSAHLMQTTSVLRNPVFLSGKNYNGNPNLLRHSLLRDQLLRYFGADMTALPEAVFVPLGDTVAEALAFLASQGVISRDRILDGLPHPSGANAERIAYFLGKKDRQSLSIKTNAAKLDAARVLLTSRLEALT